MALHQVDIGVAPNDGTGETLRGAFDNLNKNNTKLQTKLGADDESIVLKGNIGKRFLDCTAATEIYEDIVFPAETLNPPGIGTPPTPVVSGQSGIQFALEYTVNDTLFVAAQMPHAWIPGTRVYPHIHIQPQTNGAVTWEWDGWFEIADIGGTFGTSTVIPRFQTVVGAGNQWKHLLFGMPSGGIDMTGFTGPSTVVRLKYQLAVSPSALHVIGFDVHYRWGGSPVIYSP